MRGRKGQAEDALAVLKGKQVKSEPQDAISLKKNEKVEKKSTNPIGHPGSLRRCN